MKHLKTYENLKEPQECDYVVCDSSNFIQLKSVVKDSIGKIININNDEFTVRYEKYDENIIFWIHEILYSSPNIEDVKAYLKAKKYNI